ncbi:PREDICTED: uncharacterized protein LOC104822580 [Tarenaya hassleriana]|uniref:uncharacterized protein LOC104822580 n=1 Tax=Tarenaya hassleriana TaxID=28532 RepID=UPI00053C674B|nr:PREDICTED: uncharacterized protein LOC104822580 [Tarenaya hassleriana]
MEALWKIEDKLKLTTQVTVVFLVVTAAAVALLCMAMAAVLGRNPRGRQIADAEWAETAVGSCRWGRVKRRLMGSFCWSSATRWEDETLTQSQTQTQQPALLLAGRERSRNAVDPVWKRPILMGEKCRLPRFSGLILYDESGRLLRNPRQASLGNNKQKHGPVGRTTLRDLL